MQLLPSVVVHNLRTRLPNYPENNQSVLLSRSSCSAYFGVLNGENSRRYFPYLFRVPVDTKADAEGPESRLGEFGDAPCGAG